MLEEAFTHYIDNQDTFVEKYDGKVIVLKGRELLGVYDTVTEAYWWAYENDLLGQVLIHKVGPGEDNYSLTISSQLLFA